MPETSQALADDTAGFVQRQLEHLVERHLSGLELPRVFAGHPVGPDVRADLAFTLGHLHGSGLGAVAGQAAPEAIARVLRPIDGPATHTFFSYRVAETLARFGPFEGNPILSGWSAAERENLAAACDSTAAVKLYDRGLFPRNYAAVIARCERAREALGLPADTALLERMLADTKAMLSANPRGFLDDSHSRISRYDIYSADVYLFTEPLADRLGEAWRAGLDHALGLVELTAQRDGSAISWGRSTGALSCCLTLELAALAVGRGLAKDPARWLALARNARRRFEGWMSDGLINAHQHRSPYAYRGPQRRLQMTLDALGKLAYAALELRRAPGDLAPVPAEACFSACDTLAPFSEDPPTGVWAYRSRDLAFLLPVVGATLSDYLPAPRNPGLFEVPVDSDLATGVPFALKDGVRYAAGHLPREIRKTDAGLELDYPGFAQAGLFEWSGEAQTLAGRRRVAFRVDGRTLHADERLHFDEPPDAVALQVTETRGRPLHVEFECDAPHRVDRIDTDGLASYRSFWAELPRLHQIDVDPAAEIRLRWSVTPKLRVASTAHGHHYHRSLYDPLSDRVHDVPLERAAVDRPGEGGNQLRDLDFLHLHWPEWLLGPDPAAHRAFIDWLGANEVRIVWTQHNRAPHRADDRYEPIYQLWAEACHGAIHHSRWGEAWMRRTFRYGEHTQHRVIPHGHFGNLMPGRGAIDRAAAEAELGLEPCALRIGVIGAPRAEKKTQMLMEAFAAVPRDDLQLLVLSLGPDDVAPDDPRIRALPYEFVGRDVYNTRLATIDLLAMPIEGSRYLTTGGFADAVGLGIAALVSDWPFGVEMLGDAALVYGQGREALERCLRELDPARVATAAAASKALQPVYAWERIAEETYAFLEAIGTAKL